MSKISLSQEKFALVSNADYKWLNQWKWSVNKCHKIMYAHRSFKNPGTNPQKIYMHRLIMGFPEGKEVDHINHNGLDNRRCNLRIVTHRQNCINSRLRKGTSQHTGVSWRKNRRKWRAYITVDSKVIFLGNFNDEKEAILVRKQAEEKYFGQYVRQG